MPVYICVSQANLEEVSQDVRLSQAHADDRAGADRAACAKTAAGVRFPEAQLKTLAIICAFTSRLLCQMFQSMMALFIKGDRRCKLFDWAGGHGLARAGVQSISTVLAMQYETRLTAFTHVLCSGWHLHRHRPVQRYLMWMRWGSRKNHVTCYIGDFCVIS